MAFDGEPSPREVLTREVAADLVPEHRAGVAAALRLGLLRNEPHRGDATAALGGRLGELPQRGIGACAGPVDDKRV